MSLLTPLYVLGLLAVSLPIVFHLIRRAPRGDFQFSSLMFLSPSPPRLTRRSRLDHLLLLLLRGLVLGLLAFAFARPFLRQEAPTAPSAAEQQRVAIVIDTSASMRRGDLWQQATTIVDEIVAELKPHDQLALFASDDALRTLISFEDMSKLEPAQRKAAINGRLSELSPTWAGTHLGHALLEVVEIVNSVAGPVELADGKRSTTPQATPTARRVVLVSDLQQGSRFDAIADYEWPADVPLDLRTVKTTRKSNAGLQLLADAAPSDTAADADLRIRVLNDRESAAEHFQLQWYDAADRPLNEPISVYVPPGESRVARVPRPQGQAAVSQRLRLSGDENDFDNTLYFAARPPAEVSVFFLGPARADDTSGLSYYLERALVDHGGRTASLRPVATGEPLALATPAETPLVVVADEPSPEQTQSLRKHVEGGGTVLWVVTRTEPSAELAALLGVAPISVEEVKVNDYTMLGEIAFDHPLFAPMAAPQFNDFTQIYFFKYRRLAGGKLPDANVVARFENGDPAILERRFGTGRVIIFTSGWHPADSRFARSWKFVPMILTLVDDRVARLAERSTFIIHESVPFAAPEQAVKEFAVIKPDGTTMLLAGDATAFAATDHPGVYALKVADKTESFAVNLDPVESRTSVLTVETLEQYGARLVNSTATVDNDKDGQQQMRDVQLESRQKYWQWLIVAALCVSVAETCLAGWLTKSSHAKTESV